MGQKVNPVGMRIGIIRDWDATWYAPKAKVADLLLEDLKIRSFINSFYKAAYISRVEIKRTGKRIIVIISTAKTGCRYRKRRFQEKRSDSRTRKTYQEKCFPDNRRNQKPDLDATLVARKIAEDLENRASFRRVQKMAIQRALKAGAKESEQSFPVVWAVRKSRAAKVTSKEAFLCIPFAPTSTTQQPKP